MIIYTYMILPVLPPQGYSSKQGAHKKYCFIFLSTKYWYKNMINIYQENNFVFLFQQTTFRSIEFSKWHEISMCLLKCFELLQNREQQTLKKYSKSLYMIMTNFWVVSIPNDIYWRKFGERKKIPWKGGMTGIFK